LNGHTLGFSPPTRKIEPIVDLETEGISSFCQYFIKVSRKWNKHWFFLCSVGTCTCIWASQNILCAVIAFQCNTLSLMKTTCNPHHREFFVSPISYLSCGWKNYRRPRVSQLLMKKIEVEILKQIHTCFARHPTVNFHVNLNFYLKWS